MYKNPLSCNEAFIMYANSHQFENHHCKSCVLTCRSMDANPGIDEGGGGGYSTYISRGSGACCRTIFC